LFINRFCLRRSSNKQYWEVIADKLSAVGARFALLVFVVASAFAKSPAPEVIFISPCECQGFHGKNRWIVKTDFTPVPLDKSAIQSVTPSQIYAWEGLGTDVDLTRYSESRLPSEEKWYALTGRVVDAKVEADGDIHIALEDATGNNVGTVSAEVPVGSRWCEIRQAVFGWTTQKFPFSVKTAHALKIREPHVVTVMGKAYYDIGHAPADHSNRRSTPKGYAMWEIHPGDENGTDSMMRRVSRKTRSLLLPYRHFATASVGIFCLH
jgi:hypothetical protein